MSNQPDWKCIGHIGDCDPIAHGGGFVYVDRTGVYAPEVTWFEPASDEQWHKTESETPVQVYRFSLDPPRFKTLKQGAYQSTFMPNERSISWTWHREWYVDDLESVATSTGRTKFHILRDLFSPDPITLALAYSDMIHYHGIENFDSYPVTYTEREAYNRYAAELRLSLRMKRRPSIAPPWRFDLVSHMCDVTDYRDDIRGAARIGITFTKTQGVNPFYGECRWHADIELGEPFGSEVPQ